MGDGATDSGMSAFAPEEIGGEAEEHDDDGGDEIVELVGVAEGEKNGVANDGRRGEDEDEWRPGIAWNAVRNGLALRCAADGKDGRGAEPIENPTDKNHAADELAERAERTGRDKDARPYAQADDGSGGGLKARVNFGEFLEEKIVIGHGVEDARRGEQNAIGGTEGGNQDGERNDFAGPWAEDLADGGGGDRVTGSHARGAEGEQVRDDGEKIEADKNQRAGEERTGKILLRVNDFAGTIGSELPAFIGPQNSDHRQAEIGPQAEPVLGGAHGGRNFAGVPADGEEHGAEDHDNADLDERGPILKVRTFASAPDIYCGHDSDYQDGHDRLSCKRNRNNSCEIFAESACESGHGAAGDERKRTPAVEEG